MVFDYAVDVSQKSRFELEGHKRFLRDFEFARNVKARCGAESKPWVVFRMAHQNDGAEPELFTLLEAGADQCGPDPLALKFWQDRHRAKTHPF